MRIAFISNNYTPYSGGVVSSIESFTTELQKQGHEVFIITLNFLGEKHTDPNHIIRIPCPVKFLYKKNHMAIPWRTNFHIRRILKKIEPDIVHAHHPFLLGKSALNITKKLSIPIVFTYHTLYEQYAHYFPFPQEITQAVIKKITVTFCSELDGIIAPSSAIQTYLKQSGIKTPTTVTPSGLQSLFINKQFPIKKRHKRFKLLTVSRFVKEKNLTLLFDVIKHLPQTQFVFTIIGYGAEFSNLRHYAYTTLQLSPKHVQFIYKPDKNTIANSYREADLFLFSSLCDTQGLVLAEAMAGGTPVVALKGPGQNDIIKQGINGFLVQSQHEMVKAIKQIAQDTVLHRSMQQAAWQTSKNYWPAHATQQLINWYKTTIAQHMT